MDEMTGEKLTRLIERETKKRTDIYHDFAPGTEQCEVKPFTLREFYPAIWIFVMLAGLFLWAAVGIFPRYFPS